MTNTRKPVRRVTVAQYQFRGGQRRPLVVTVEGETLAFRFLGTRQTYRYPVYSVALTAMQAAGAAERAARKAARKAGMKFDGAKWRRENLT
jgi:hypothetical protein